MVLLTKYRIFLLLAFLFFITPILQATFEFKKPTAEDWVRHEKWVKMYITGDFSNAFQYPPFYHFLMLPFVLIMGNSIKFLQPIIATLGFYSILKLVDHTENKNAVLLTAFMLGSSYNFVTYSSTLTPQAIGFILMPVAITGLLQKNYKKMSVCLLIYGGMHEFGIFLMPIFFIYSALVDKNALKYILLIAIILSPVLLIPYFNETIKAVEYIDMENLQVHRTEKTLFYSYPLWRFIIFSGFLFWLLIPITIYSMKHIKKYDKTQLFYVVWFMVVLPLSILNVWRWWSFAIIPATLFSASVIGKYFEGLDDNRQKKKI